MNYSSSKISPELIFSHIWAIRSDARLAIMQQSLDSLITEIGSPKIIPNDLTVISYLIKNHGEWFSMACEGYSMSLTEKYEDRFLNLDFADLVLFVSLYYNYTDIQRSHTKNLLKKYFKRRESGYSESTMLFPGITSLTYGLVIYREQAEKLIMSITDMDDEEAKKLLRDLRKGDAKAHNYGDTFISLGEAKGLPRKKVRRVWALISRQAQLLTDYKFSIKLSWLLYQLQFLQTYYSTRVWTKIERFAKQYEHSLDVYRIEKINSLSLFSDINSHKYLWSKCKARLSEFLPESQFALFENVSSASFRSSTLTLKISGRSYFDRKETLDKIESFMLKIRPIFQEIYGADMKIVYEYEI